MNDLAVALNKHGLNFLTDHQYELAESFFREAIVHAQLADAYTNLGVVLYLNKRYDDAAIALHQSCTLRPSHPETLLNLGYCLCLTKDFEGARAAFQRAIDLADLPLAHIALGSLYVELCDLDKAIEHSRIGLRHHPDSVIARDTLREVLHHKGNEAEALAECDILFNLAPEYPQHRYKRSLVMLTYGNPEGWAEHECRYAGYGSRNKLLQSGHENPQWFSRLFGKRWEGQRTEHLMVHTEQGFGDIIQFMRFIPLAAERCAKLSVYLPPALRRLARQSFKLPNLDICDEVPTEFNHYCLIMSLPYLLERTQDIPPPPYLVAGKHSYGEIRRLDGIKIGVAWQGIHSHRDNRWRSMPFETMTRLFSLPANFISLQLPCDIDFSHTPLIDVHPVPIPYDGGMMLDWTETAALIDALDLVICVDTAVAHMAGAIGKPVWLLNRFNTDWRWMLHRTDSPWYPSMRIFRQPKMGDWDSVMETVISELQYLISDDA